MGRLTRDGRPWLWYKPKGDSYKNYECDVGSHEWLNYFEKDNNYYIKINGKKYKAKFTFRELKKNIGRKIEVYDKDNDLKFEIVMKNDKIKVLSVYDCGKLDSTKFGDYL